ncbi:hypothetical protein AKJ55_01590 [candidate division MSBL1 archaeon SCGC-AAA382M17]|uniref:Tyr recombinase domain-containing protein n=1 Tax=candidate division MSBL1 archaeon SCGC-AAA382M17 TaxID=1698284 RepID=A0ABR5TJA4_9EURY|nr:hypothetical protein AKJ55_01590 [candidate division MSBL1 archaeon SCGC-AAA382M17]
MSVLSGIILMEGLRLFESFLEDYERRDKDKTASTYRKLLSQFEKWVDDRGDFGKFAREDVLEFLDQQDNWANASKNVFLAALKSWAKSELEKVEPAVTDEEKLEARRLKRIRGIKGYDSEAGEKEALSLEEISDLRVAMRQDSENLFWVLLWFGIRVGELKKINQIDWGEGRIEVETLKRKGSGKTRVLFFDDYTERILRRVVDKKLHELPYQTVYRKFKRASRPLETDLTPHVCRHTFATHMAERTDPFTLAKMLGHSTQGISRAVGGAKVTGRYVHPFEEEIRRLMTEDHYLAPLEVR